MFTSAVTTLTFLSTLFLSRVSAIDQTVHPDLVAKLKTAATQLDRLNLLPDNSDWLFDFNAQKSYTFNPGSVVNANVSNGSPSDPNDADMYPSRQLPFLQWLAMV